MTCDEPHGILQRKDVKALAEGKRTDNAPLCVTENAFAVQDRDYRC